MKYLLLTCVFVSCSFGAVVTTYTSRAAFLGAIGSSTTFDFTAPDGPISNLGALLAITTVGGDANGQILGNALCGSTANAVDCFPPVLLTFTSPGNAFGYDNLDFTLDEEAVVTLNFSNLDPAQIFVFDLAGQPAFTPTFFGVTSDVNLASVQIYSRTPGTTDVGARANVIDNVTVGTSAVPEPSTVGVSFVGLIGLLTLHRYRRAA